MRRLYKITYNVLGARTSLVTDAIVADSLTQALEDFTKERESDGVIVRYSENAIVNIQILKP